MCIATRVWFLSKFEFSNELQYFLEGFALKEIDSFVLVCSRSYNLYMYRKIPFHRGFSSCGRSANLSLNFVCMHTTSSVPKIEINMTAKNNSVIMPQGLEQ